ncbi:isochorismatase, partial [Staphylococcus epidermidis]
MSNKALIIVDYSFDFIDDSGKLTCGKPGQEIETFITQRIKNY